MQHFYSLKSKVTGGERFIVKLLLNGLYGYFGRKPINNETEIITIDEARELLKKDDINLNWEIELTEDLLLVNYTRTRGKPVATNVAIASAITSQSRLYMHPFKTDPNNPCLYSDTDSVFIQYPLPSELIGNGLGQFKDELNGDIITEAVFLRNKCYGYITNTGKSKVVIAGFPRGDVSYNELMDVYNGGSVTSIRKILRKDINNLSIKSIELTRTLRMK